MTRHFHVVAGKAIGVEALRAEIAAGARPRHFMLLLADALGAKVWEPSNREVPVTGLLYAQLLRPQANALAMAHEIASTIGDDDVVLCNGEDVGLSIAAELKRRRSGAKLAIICHNLLRPRMFAARTVTRVFERVDILFLNSPVQYEALRKRYRSGARPSVEFVKEQTDDRFFSPGPNEHSGARPVIASVGLEQRDYITLAEATKDLDVDVRISGFSKDAAVMARTFPAENPANMTSRFYEWDELAQLYRDADIVVAPLQENRFAAGTTAILEAMAAARPVISTRTSGISGVLTDDSAVAWVPPGDVAALRDKIVALLGDENARKDLAARGAALMRTGHGADDAVAAMAARLREIK